MKGIQFHPEYYEGQQNFNGKLFLKVRKTRRITINTTKDNVL